ncbi:putative methyltransferase DDB_G0268948 [Amphiura filiformis]|uniref:putative methyltransferase DDB_G0268948 n=1 Tax=Amphiura filiformis TaxID=82378 RepID=UPI003B21D205
MASEFTGLKHAALYSKYRPKPSPAVINNILEFLKEKKKSPCLLAVDVACGSGQSTDVLGEYFESVLGCDISDAQVNEARKANTAPNINYCVADAEHIPVADNSVDLVTCSQAAHWFDFPAFCKEVDRVLKPSGCLAVYAASANHPRFLHDDDKIATKLSEIVSSFYSETLNGYWGFPLERHHKIYQEELKIPYPRFQRMMQTLGVDKSPDEIIFKTVCPIFLLLGRKPQIDT